MYLSEAAWTGYIHKLAALNRKASNQMLQWMETHIYDTTDELIAYAYALATKYGEGSAALSCEMYDLIAELQSRVLRPPAVPAETASYETVAKTVNGVIKESDRLVPAVVGRLVKQAGADTTLQNALRDGAEFAWIPSGDSCAFCLTVASQGWQRASKKSIRNGHASHIHSNCNCEYAIRFSAADGVAGYAPDRYLEQYEKAGRDINTMRRAQYAENRKKITAQKRAAYRRAHPAEDAADKKS